MVADTLHINNQTTKTEQMLDDPYTKMKRFNIYPIQCFLFFSYRTSGTFGFANAQTYTSQNQKSHFSFHLFNTYRCISNILLLHLKNYHNKTADNGSNN